MWRFFRPSIVLPKVKHGFTFALEGGMLCSLVSICKCTCFKPCSKDPRRPPLGHTVVPLWDANSSKANVWHFLILHEKRREDDVSMDYPSWPIHYCTSTANPGLDRFIPSTYRGHVVTSQWYWASIDDGWWSGWTASSPKPVANTNHPCRKSIEVVRRQSISQ